MQTRKLHVWIASALLAFALNATAFTGGPLRSGKITNFRLVDAVTFSWNTDDYGDQPFLAEGEKFAIVSVNLAKDRTIGKYDYKLGGVKCLAMAQQQDPYDPDKWEFKFSGAATEVHMLYKVKSDSAPFSFEFQLTNREPVLKVTTTGVTGFGEGPDPNAFSQAAAAAPAAPAVDGGGEAAPAEGGDDAAAPAEDGGDAAAEPAAAAAKDEPAAEPAAAEAKKEPEPKKKDAGNSILDDW
jgi:hypothetical protein